MSKWLIILFACILFLISFALKRNSTSLLVLFSNKNKNILKSFMISLFILAIIGIIIGLAIPTKIAGLIYVVCVLLISAFFSTTIANNMPK